MRFEGQLIQVAILELNLCLRLSLLSPEKGHWAANLQVGEQSLRVVEIYDYLCFHKVWHASVLVDATGVKTRTSPGCVSTRDYYNADVFLEELNGFTTAAVTLNYWGKPLVRDTLEQEVLQ